MVAQSEINVRRIENMSTGVNDNGASIDAEIFKEKLLEMLHQTLLQQQERNGELQTKATKRLLRNTKYEKPVKDIVDKISQISEKRTTQGQEGAVSLSSCSFRKEEVREQSVVLPTILELLRREAEDLPTKKNKEIKRLEKRNYFLQVKLKLLEAKNRAVTAELQAKNKEVSDLRKLLLEAIRTVEKSRTWSDGDETTA